MRGFFDWLGGTLAKTGCFLVLIVGGTVLICWLALR